VELPSHNVKPETRFSANSGTQAQGRAVVLMVKKTTEFGCKLLGIVALDDHPS
jgi:hypothetical protein